MLRKLCEWVWPCGVVLVLRRIYLPGARLPLGAFAGGGGLVGGCGRLWGEGEGDLPLLGVLERYGVTDRGLFPLLLEGLKEAGLLGRATGV